jgi:hypothetical protein
MLAGKGFTGFPQSPSRLGSTPSNQSSYGRSTTKCPYLEGTKAESHYHLLALITPYYLLLPLTDPVSAQKALALQPLFQASSQDRTHMLNE